jgi:putative ATP-dependent endonuclease of the OLD family
MKIKQLNIRNYRTLESVDLDFPSSYTAICGPNDCGKTNVVRGIRALMKEAEPPFRVFNFEDEEEVSITDDFPKWKDTKATNREIQFELTLSVQRERDAGFVQFLTRQLSIKTDEPSIDIAIVVKYRSDSSEADVQVRCLGKEHTGIDAQEVLKRLQSSRSILFHNSGQIDTPMPFRMSGGGYIRTASPEHEPLVASMKATVNRGLAKISKSHQKDLEDLLGRLETKYKVSLSMPAFDFVSVPFNVTLGQKKCEVPLDDWGSGTKNRTLILLTLFRAKQLGDSQPSASKITPVIIIEEPESFLHPAAQAEFGRILHDLAEEFEVQVIATTHSPYLLNIDDPACNVLLSRRTLYKQLRETERVDTTGDNWMKPFGLALGLESEEFKPWKELILSGSDAILLVEGDTDRQYFEMLKDPEHGAHRLDFSGEIVSYGGTGSLQNTVLLRFIKNRYRRLFVTYDLDAEKHLEKTLTGLGLERKKHYTPVGLNTPGKRNIKGLLPEAITTSVYGAHPSLVQEAMQGTKDEQESARNKLKKLLLEEFKKKASPGPEYFGNFYPLIKTINSALD